jgi:HEAT repeat protein
MAETSEPSADQLVATLSSSDATARENARNQLVALGAPAVPRLLTALGDPKSHVRWEAGKALTHIADPSAAAALAARLADEDQDVRWVVGEALVALRRHAVKPVLEQLCGSTDTECLYNGAHHVLHDLAKLEALQPLLTPVLTAFDKPRPEVSVPVAAETALRDHFR